MRANHYRQRLVSQAHRMDSPQALHRVPLRAHVAEHLDRMPVLRPYLVQQSLISFEQRRVLLRDEGFGRAKRSERLQRGLVEDLAAACPRLARPRQFFSAALRRLPL